MDLYAKKTEISAQLSATSDQIARLSEELDVLEEQDRAEHVLALIEDREPKPASEKIAGLTEQETALLKKRSLLEQALEKINYDIRQQENKANAQIMEERLAQYREIAPLVAQYVGYVAHAYAKGRGLPPALVEPSMLVASLEEEHRDAYQAGLSGKKPEVKA